MTAVYHFTIPEGAHFGRTFQWKDDAGAPVDLSGWTAAMHLRASQASAVRHDWSPYVTMGGPDGKVVLSVPADAAPALLAELLRGAGVYDLELTPPTGAANTVRFLEGTWVLSREVTRP